MNNDRVKGKVDEIVGSVKRHFGNVTGDSRTQVEGAAQQIKGKVETAVGKFKDAAHNAKVKSPPPHETNANAEADGRHR